MLNNPFYMGLIRLRTTGELFPGVHEPIISKAVYDSVQDVLHGRVTARTTKHGHLFRRIVRCGYCTRALIGERQKGRVYYRCHTRRCTATTLREDYIDKTVLRTLAPLQLTDFELRGLDQRIEQLRSDAGRDQEGVIRNLSLRRARLDQRMDRVTDAYIDQLIDRQTFEHRKNGILLEQKDVEDRLNRTAQDKYVTANRMAEIVEQLRNVKSSYILAEPAEKREMLCTVTSNRVAWRKKLDVELRSPFREIAKRRAVSNCDPSRDGPRTLTGEVADVDSLYAFLYQYCDVEVKKHKDRSDTEYICGG